MRKSFLSRAINNERSESVNPLHPRDPALAVLFGGGAGTSSGVLISENTAMSITAVYAAVNLVSETIAMLPWNMYERLNPGRKIALDDPRHMLVSDQPNRWQNSYEFREMLVSQLMIRGRSLCEIIVNSRGDVTDLMPLQPGTYSPFYAPDKTVAFSVQQPDGARRILLSDEVIDVRGHPDPNNPLLTLSPIRANSETLGITRASESYAGAFFGNGTVVSGVLETDGALSDNAYTRLKQWTKRHQGVARSHNPAILEEGLKWRQTSVNAEDAQLIETRKHQVDDIARIFRIPSYKLGSMDRANFNNVEQQSIDFATDTIVPKIDKIIRAIDRGIFSIQERKRFYTQIMISKLLRGDSKTRSEYYKTMWQLGSISPNEIRELEEENPIDGGDRYYVPVNYAPVDRIDDFFNGKTPSELPNDEQ